MCADVGEDDAVGATVDKTWRGLHESSCQTASST
jgi:hypothetical protein